jgi:hypothetical protein
MASQGRRGLGKKGGVNFSFWKTERMLGYFLNILRPRLSWVGSAVFHSGLEDNNARNEGSYIGKSYNRLK